jgi:hypothetical protein
MILPDVRSRQFISTAAVRRNVCITNASGVSRSDVDNRRWVSDGERKRREEKKWAKPLSAKGQKRDPWAL